MFACLSVCLSDFLDEQPRAHIVKFITMHARTEISARHLHRVNAKQHFSVQNKPINNEPVYGRICIKH